MFFKFLPVPRLLPQFYWLLFDGIAHFRCLLSVTSIMSQRILFGLLSLSASVTFYESIRVICNQGYALDSIIEGLPCVASERSRVARLGIEPRTRGFSTGFE